MIQHSARDNGTKSGEVSDPAWSMPASRGDPPSVTGQHTASKKRPRDEDEDDRVGLQELVDSLMA